MWRTQTSWWSESQVFVGAAAPPAGSVLRAHSLNPSQRKVRGLGGGGPGLEMDREHRRGPGIRDWLEGLWQTVQMSINRKGSLQHSAWNFMSKNKFLKPKSQLLTFQSFQKYWKELSQQLFHIFHTVVPSICSGFTVMIPSQPRTHQSWTNA